MLFSLSVYGRATRDAKDKHLAPSHTYIAEPGLKAACLIPDPVFIPPLTLSILTVLLGNMQGPFSKHQVILIIDNEYKRFNSTSKIFCSY